MTLALGWQQKISNFTEGAAVFGGLQIEPKNEVRAGISSRRTSLSRVKTAGKITRSDLSNRSSVCSIETEGKNQVGDGGRTSRRGKSDVRAGLQRWGSRAERKDRSVRH
jgi:hypothetical protein